MSANARACCEVGAHLDRIEESCVLRFQLCESCERKRRELCLVSIGDDALCPTCRNSRKAYYAVKTELTRCAGLLDRLHHVVCFAAGDDT